MHGKNHRKIIAALNKFDLDNLALIVNKLSCAKQAASPTAVPADIPSDEARVFFRNALYTLSDCRFLQKVFWRELAANFKVSATDFLKMTVSFNAGELFLSAEEPGHDTCN
jgi:hypothetical protein